VDVISHKLGPVSEIPPDGAREYELTLANKPLQVFVINEAGRYFAYLNRCPHTGINLNWQPNQFFSLDNLHIQCSVHGALFRKQDGHCVWGPCVGRSLRAVETELRQGELHILLDEYLQQGIWF